MENIQLQDEAGTFPRTSRYLGQNQAVVHVDPQRGIRRHRLFGPKNQPCPLPRFNRRGDLPAAVIYRRYQELLSGFEPKVMCFFHRDLFGRPQANLNFILWN